MKKFFIAILATCALMQPLVRAEETQTPDVIVTVCDCDCMFAAAIDQSTTYHDWFRVWNALIEMGCHTPPWMR